MKILITSIKAAVLSSSLFFLYLLVFEHIGELIIPLYFLSIVITFFIAGGMIFFTIMPFSLFGNDNTLLFKKIFPIYALIFFIFCLGLIIASDFEKTIVAIFFIVYITAMQSWVWIFKSTMK